jgi:hypothetical protein
MANLRVRLKSAKGRLDTFGAPLGNDRCLRIPLKKSEVWRDLSGVQDVADIEAQ